MTIEEITRDKSLMRITWLTLSLTSRVGEDELLMALSSLLEEYFIRYDSEWLDLWIKAAEEYSHNGNPHALLDLMADATEINRMISDLEANPGMKSTLN